MNISIFTSVLIFIICILGGLAGVTFLILGLVNKKSNWTIGGIIGSVISLIIIVGLIVSNVMKYSGVIKEKIRTEIEQSRYPYQHNNTFENENELSINDTLSLVLSNGKKILIDVTCKGMVFKNNLFVKSINSSKQPSSNKTAIAIVFLSKDSIKGELSMTLIEQNEREYLSSNEFISINKSEEKEVMFLFPKLDFEIIEKIEIEFSKNKND